MRKLPKINFAVVCIAGVFLLSLMNARAMAGEYGKGDPKHPISNSNWPKGLDVVANRVDRIGGYWINSSDTFYYSGDAADFNNFLNDYSRVQSQSLTLIIDNSAGPIGLFQPTDSSTNWQLGCSGWSTANVSVTIPLHGRIALNDIKAPLNITLYTYGEKDAAAEAFIAAHNSAQSRALDAAKRKTLTSN